MPSDDTRVRGLTFGSGAERYERFRPGYPEAVADLVLAPLDSSGPVRALEIGAGTGKATRLFVGRGVAVTAVEPDPQMAAVLERVTRGLPVTVVRSTLEALPAQVTQPTYDLVYAAAAWHWTDPATRWSRAAALLRTGGVFASFGGPVDVVDPDLAEAIEAVRSEVMETDAVPEPWVRPAVTTLAWPGNELLDSPFFTDVAQHDLTSTFTMGADDLVGLLSTVSAYLLLADDVRADVLARVRAALPEQVEARRDLVVHTATRTTVAAPDRA